MMSLGRLLCFLTILGLFSELAAAMPKEWAGDHSRTTMADGCGEKSQDADHAPVDPMHDCCCVCVHLFDPASSMAMYFRARHGKSDALPASGLEVDREGFPSGLFIPPRLS